LVTLLAKEHILDQLSMLQQLTQVWKLAQPALTMARGTPFREVADGVWSLRTAIVNVAFVAESDDSWVLIDAGLGFSANDILDHAEDLFGDEPPVAIYLTHGHFDHVGALEELLEEWGDVPVYAHTLELPYITGKSSYPPPDPSVGGGAMAWLSFAYPKGPIDLGSNAQPIPQGKLPGLPGWRIINTPGHSPGHISFFREDDRTLIAGDAFVTTKQESFTAVLLQKEEVNGPPMYFTADWEQARRSVEALAALEPDAAITGHGTPMYGEELRKELRRVSEHFDLFAMPEHGRYVESPALTDEYGVVEVPPRAKLPFGTIAVALGLVVAGTAAVIYARKNR
jgi:glyoxylase-like metal-dependent hydrolase (beta-lactamase superfamily II)